MGLLRQIFREATKPIRAKIRGAKGERKVDAKLNPLIFGKVEHRQINNLILLDEKGKTHQIDHVEIRENGIFCIETKNYIGWIFGNENSDKWTQTLYTGEKHQFINPVKQNKVHCYHLANALGNKHKVFSLIVMANNNADKIKCQNAINLKDLKYCLKHFNSGVHYSTEQMDKIYNTLLRAHHNISNREHVNNIKQTQREIDSNICPRCGGKLVLRKSANGSFYGCSNYPRCRFVKKT